MDQNQEFLTYIYQNSQMGITTIEQLKTKVGQQEFNNQLHSQLQEYQTVNEAAAKQLRENGHTEKSIPKAQELGAYMSIALKTLTNHSPSHISEMMMQGSVMGVIDITKNLKKYPNAPAKTKTLANKLLQIEESNIQSLKGYL